MIMEVALMWFALLTLVTLMIEVETTYITQGVHFGFSSNRPTVERKGLALRIGRAYANQVESAAYIVPMFAAALYLEVTTPGMETAAAIVVLGRLGFVLMYYTGIHFARVPFFMATVLALFHIGWGLVRVVV